MHEKLNKSNLELNQEIENLEKELEEEKSKQSENDNLVRINRTLSLFLFIEKKKNSHKKIIHGEDKLFSSDFLKQNLRFPFCLPSYSL